MQASECAQPFDRPPTANDLQSPASQVGRDQLLEAGLSAKHVESDGASMADMLRSLPAPAGSTEPVRAPGSYPASLGSVLWVSDSEAELQPASRLPSAVQSSHYSSIDLLADSRSSSVSQGQVGYQRLSETGEKASDDAIAASADASTPTRLLSDSTLKPGSIAFGSNAAIFPVVKFSFSATAVPPTSAISTLASTANGQHSDSSEKAAAGAMSLHPRKEPASASADVEGPAAAVSSPGLLESQIQLNSSSTASSCADVHPADFAASKGPAPAKLEDSYNAPADSALLGTAGLPAGGISWQLSELDVLLMKRQASLQKSTAARRLFFDRPFSSSPVDRTSTQADMGSPRLLANSALEGWCHHSLADAQPIPRPQPSGLPTAATAAQQGLVAEHSYSTYVSASAESVTGLQVSATSQSSCMSGQEELWCLRAQGGFTEKDSSAVVGQSTPVIKLLKIGSWGRHEGGRWGRLKEDHISTTTGNERSNAERNPRKSRLLRNVSGPVFSKVGNVMNNVSSASAGKGGRNAEGTAVSAVDDSASGYGVLHEVGLLGEGDKAASVRAARLARASSRLGSLFRRS